MKEKYCTGCIVCHAGRCNFEWDRMLLFTSVLQIHEADICKEMGTLCTVYVVALYVKHVLLFTHAPPCE